MPSSITFTKFFCDRLPLKKLNARIMIMQVWTKYISALHFVYIHVHYIKCKEYSHLSFSLYISCVLLNFKLMWIILYHTSWTWLSRMVDLSITIYTCCASLSMFMFINKNLKETAFNYCAMWSGVDDQKIDCSIISIGVMCHTIWWLPLKGIAQGS